MALSKDQRDKIILGGLLAIGVMYGYSEFMIGPLNKKIENAQKELGGMDPKISSAKSQIMATKNLEARVPESEKSIAQINQMIPSGAPVAWFPTLMEGFFREHGTDHIVTRMTSDVADPLAEGYRRITWNIDIPKTDAVVFAAALADLDNQQPLIETSSLVVDFLRDTPQWQHVSFTLTNSARQ